MFKRVLYMGCFCAVAAGVSGARADATMNSYSANVEIRVATIRNLIDAKDYPAAEKLADELLTDNPGLAEGWLLLGYTRSVVGHFEASNDAYDHAAQNGASRHQVLAAKIYNFRKLGDVPHTRACYADMVTLDPTNVDVWMQYAAFETSVENYDAAVDCYASALKLQPGNEDAIDAVARVEERRGRTTQARAWLESALTRDPNDARVLKRLAALTLNAQDYVAAVGFADRALAVDPTDASVQRTRAVALFQKGDKKEAIASLEKVRELNGSMDGLYGPLADCYRAAGRDSDALAVVQQGVAAGQQTAWLYSVWGKILEGQKRYDEAIAMFDKAVAQNDEAWSDYARKQIARQNTLKKREAMIASQAGM
jgi:tetratricopeptide (TPR) repeat protein